MRLKQFNTHLNIVLFWKTFVTRKMSAIFGSGPYSPSSNFTIMNRNKQVNHSKQETISVIFTHPSPNPSAPQYIASVIWPNRKFQNYSCRYQNAVNNKQYISQFWFLKLTKQIKFKFCFCLTLGYKAFLTVLLNIYNIFFWLGDLQWAHYTGHSFPCKKWLFTRWARIAIR